MNLKCLNGILVYTYTHTIQHWGYTTFERSIHNTNAAIKLHSLLNKSLRFSAKCQVKRCQNTNTRTSHHSSRRTGSCHLWVLRKFWQVWRENFNLGSSYNPNKRVACRYTLIYIRVYTYIYIYMYIKEDVCMHTSISMSPKDSETTEPISFRFSE